MIYGVKCIEFNLPDFTIGKHEIMFTLSGASKGCNNYFVRVNVRGGSKTAIPRGIEFEYSPGIWGPRVPHRKGFVLDSQ